MQNQEIVKIIENLKGRRNYEEKKASKLGFAFLYDYFEDKISKKQKAIEEEQKELEVAKSDRRKDVIKSQVKEAKHLQKLVNSVEKKCPHCGGKI